MRTPPGTRPFVEDHWLGRQARLGEEARVEFHRSSERCVMVNTAQQDLPHSPEILRAIARAHGNTLDALATVVVPGSVRVGDLIALV